MKATLREKLIIEIKRIENRIFQLKRNACEYAKSNQVNESIINSAKANQLILVVENLKEILK